ncbi:MAG: hypothetical protein QOE55_1034 [Acidobacteriaceae bacterium]|nr:hypothetical protein [Acidobacteriaceae bacterium]
MLGNSNAGIGRPYVPTFADIQRRRAELCPPSAPAPAPQPATGSPRTPSPRPTVYPKLGEAALYGVAGLAVRALAPHTEAHPAAILLQLLAAFGNAVGPAPHCMVDATRHGLNLFVVLVGESSKGRKGTSWNQIRRLFAEADHPWVAERVTTARLTPASLIHALRDQQPATDRRLLALSEEFAAVLHTLGRAKGHLSPLLRCAWDSGDLRSLDGRSPIQASGTHISLIAHITQRELAQHLHPTEAHNGFANRCLWTLVQRSKCLPEGGNLGAHELSAVAAELRRALDWVGHANGIRLSRDEEARDLWHEGYPELSQVRPGLYGAATSRAEAQVLRLSALYSVLDCSPIIGLPHLQAALAVWNYCAESAALFFGTSTGDPIADRIREAIDASFTGLSRKQMSALFHGHVTSERIEAALQQLLALGAIGQARQPSGGRPTTLWSATPEEEFVREGEIEDDSTPGETTDEESMQEHS